jgi:hypothetical protein
MAISAPKSKWMVFGRPTHGSGVLHVDGAALECVSRYKFVGIWFSSTTRDIFENHYDEKATKACRVACASFTLDEFVGTLAPPEGVRLYMARVDPVLTFGSEIVLDINRPSIDKLADVQHLFIRRLLRVGSRSMLAPLFTETGILPLRFRRVTLAVAYLMYLLQLPPTHFAYAALKESISLLRKGYSCWIADLNWVIHHLPGARSTPSGVDVENMNRSQLRGLQNTLEEWCDAHLCQELLASPKCAMLVGRYGLAVDRVGPHPTRKLRHYLALPTVPAHRKAFTALMFSTHSLAVERLRWKERYRAPVPREWRLCRFCRGGVEDEVHALLVCQGHPDFSPLRLAMQADVQALLPGFHWGTASCHTQVTRRLLVLLHDRRLAVLMAKFIYDILNIFDSHPMFIPPPYLYSPLLTVGVA